jgi:hypothetical protein
MCITLTLTSTVQKIHSLFLASTKLWTPRLVAFYFASSIVTQVTTR